MRRLFNLEAEQAVLGLLLWDNAALERLPALEAHQFYDPVHGRIYDEIVGLIRAGGLADGITLKEKFEADGGLKQIGGAGYLLTLGEAAAKLVIHGIEYAEIIRDMYGKREASVALRSALARLEEDGADLLDVVAAAENGLHSIGSHGDQGCALNEADSYFARIDAPGLPIGLDALDRRLRGLFRADLIILAGRPSMGKTTLATQLLRNVCGRGAVGHFASLEMSREGVQQRSISAATFSSAETKPTPYFDLRNGAENIDRGMLRRLASGLPRTCWIDDTPAQTLTHLEASARQTRRRFKKLDLIVVDYLQLMTARRNDGRVHEVSEISAGLKAIAKRLDVPVVALSQLSRGVESRDNKRPTLSDLRDSGSIEQDADVVIGLYRESYYHDRAEPDQIEDQGRKWREWEAKRRTLQREIEIITLKQRMGPIGTDRLEAWLEFDTIRDRGAA